MPQVVEVGLSPVQLGLSGCVSATAVCGQSQSIRYESPTSFPGRSLVGSGWSQDRARNRPAPAPCASGDASRWSERQTPAVGGWHARIGPRSRMWAPPARRRHQVVGRGAMLPSAVRDEVITSLPGRFATEALVARHPPRRSGATAPVVRFGRVYVALQPAENPKAGASSCSDLLNKPSQLVRPRTGPWLLKPPPANHNRLVLHESSGYPTGRFSRHPYAQSGVLTEDQGVWDQLHWQVIHFDSNPFPRTLPAATIGRHLPKRRPVSPR